jgi:enterochelin esterase-like enzyme
MKSSTKIILTFLIISCTLIFSQNKVPKYKVGSQISIGENIYVESKVHKTSRTILISLPTQYSSNNNRYPVIYFTDGSLERLILIRGIVDFFVDDKKMPDAIIVGIVHLNRDQELLPIDNSNKANSNSGEQIYF